MPKRMIAVVLVGVLALTGCHVRKVTQIPAAGVPQPQTERIVGVTTVKGQDVLFDASAATIANGTLHATVNKAPYELPVDQVQRFWVERREISTARTVGLVAGIVIPVAVIAAVVAVESKKTTPAATAPSSGSGSGGAGGQGSCPYVYSWDGSRYVFEAEPYGGAITRGLEKDDYSELKELKEEDGRYKLRMTNEVDETQMTNFTELWVVDHPAGTRVVPDIDGKLHTVSAQQNMLSARDAEGHDLLPWLRSTDRLIWEPRPVPDTNGSLQGDIIMTFPKPAGAKQVKLVANATTGMWGSYMIKHIVALRGRDVGMFYFALNHSKAVRKQLTDWEEREDLYRLKVYVEEPTGWEVRGVLPGTGSFNSADRVLPLDVSHVQGDQLRIRIHPTAGFWALNSFAADYTADLPVKVEKVKPTTAQDLQGKDVLSDLAATDGRYLAMPNVGDTADISFLAPPARAGSDRAVFLHSRGYYKLHVAGTGEPDKATLKTIQNVPGGAARFAASQYGKFQVAQQQQPSAFGPR